MRHEPEFIPNEPMRFDWKIAAGWLLILTGLAMFFGSAYVVYPRVLAWF